MIDGLPPPARNANPSNSPTSVAEPARLPPPPPPPAPSTEEEESRRRTTPKIVASRSRVSGLISPGGRNLRAPPVAGGGDEQTLLMVWRMTKAYSIRQAQGEHQSLP